ncbi:MAG: putative peptidoglycan-binding domain-containing protein, partial [Phocaeicola sp.]
VQRILKVKVDGIVGRVTIAAINEMDPIQAFGLIKLDRIKFIDEICASRPANNRFKKGWLNRINDLVYED